MQLDLSPTTRASSLTLDFVDPLPPPCPDIAVFILFSIPAVIMATDYCVKNEDARYRDNSPYPCYNVSQMVLSMRSLATAGIYFTNRDRRSELLDLRGLYRKVWRRLKADALGCASAATGGVGVARGTVGAGDGDGYRLQFNSEPDVQEFEQYDYSVAGSSVGSGPLHSTHGNGEDSEDEDAGMAYQLMEDDGAV